MSNPSKDKKELTEDSLKKVAGGGAPGTSSTSWHRPVKVIHHPSSSSNTTKNQ
jgi:hypothetical protein